MPDDPIIHVPQEVFRRSTLYRRPGRNLNCASAPQARLSRAEVNHGLGKFVVEYQVLEWTIKEMIGFLLRKTDWTPGFIVTADVSFRRLLDVLLALFHQRHSVERIRSST